MIRYECDQCGASLGANDGNRFIVKMEAFAAASPLSFSAEDFADDRTDELSKIIHQLEHADPDDIENQTYRQFRFDLCRACHGRFLDSPLGADPR